MGGFVSFFRSVFKKHKPPAQVQQVQQVQQQAAKTVSGRISKPYSDDTIMTSAEGLEDEANVKKAQLGGTILKKKKYKV
jgi:hypothetical protein